MYKISLKGCLFYYTDLQWNPCVTLKKYNKKKGDVIKELDIKSLFFYLITKYKAYYTYS